MVSGCQNINVIELFLQENYDCSEKAKGVRNGFRCVGAFRDLPIFEFAKLRNHCLRFPYLHLTSM